MAEMLLWTNSRATSAYWGELSVKSNLESAKDSSKYAHMPTKSCCCLCCCAFRLRFSQVKVIHLQWSAWMPAINSPKDFWGPGQESREHALVRTYEAENALQKKRGNIFCWKSLTERKDFNSFFPNFVYLLCQEKNAVVSQPVMHFNRLLFYIKWGRLHIKRCSFEGEKVKFAMDDSLFWWRRAV